MPVQSTSKPRIAVGGIEHETCGFAAAPCTTSLEEFERHMLRGEAVLRLGAANTIMDGFVKGVRGCGGEVIPLAWVKGISGGPASRATFDTITSELLVRLRQAMPVDGVLLSLHGAFAAEGIDDADGAILTAVRALVGPDCPVMAVHDLHCNLTHEMARSADVLVVERTYPHTDMAERAVHTANLMARTIAGEIRPTMAFRSLPLLWSAGKMMTAEPPMQNAVDKLLDLDKQPSVLTASIGVGYQWIDSPVVGASVVVVTDGDEAFAGQRAEELGRWIWNRRADWQSEPLTPEAAIACGEEVGEFPIVLAEQGDNTGGGAPGDATQMLRLFVEECLTPSAVLYMVDPGTVAQAAAAGVGAEIEVQIGGKSQAEVGPPVPMKVRIRALSDGRFTYDGPMWAGVKGDLGPAAWLEQEGVHVVVISRRQQPVDLAFCRSLGIDCSRMRYLAVKSTGHFRSGFAPIAGSIFNVDTASVLSHDFRQLPYTRLGRKMAPLDTDADIGW